MLIACVTCFVNECDRIGDSLVLCVGVEVLIFVVSVVLL